MNKCDFIGKIIKYNPKNPDQFPIRSDFIPNDKLTAALSRKIKRRERIPVLPNDLCEIQFQESTGNGGFRSVYKLCLFSIMLNGEKVAVIVDNIKVFFDVKVPEDEPPDDFQKKILETLKENEKFPIASETEIKFMRQFIGFQESESPYIRVYFRTLPQRRKSAELLRKLGYETASDDHVYYRKASREYRFKLCDWISISEYQVNDPESLRYIKTPNITKVFRCDVSQIHDDIDDSRKNKNPLYSKDRTMIGTWDIETFSYQPIPGEAPMPDRGFDSSGNEIDSVFMNCMTFHWKSEPSPLLKVCITSMPIQPIPDSVVILCRDQEEIALAWGDLLGRMSPEFIIGFNDGGYDWPFMIERMKSLNKLNGSDVYDEFIWKTSCIKTDNPNSISFILKGDMGMHSEEIKVEADTKVNAKFVYFPGCIPLDSCIINRKLSPGTEQWSLNFFLQKYGLELKEDMPYVTMFQIFAILKYFGDTLRTDDISVIADRVQQLAEIHGKKHRIFNSKQFPGNLYKIHKLKLKKIGELVSRAWEVGNYCITDAQRCQELLVIKNVVSDFREVSNLSYTSMYDAAYRAGGVKVRNMAMMVGTKEEWNISFCSSQKGTKTEKKYPGAFVVPPKKGLYRDHRLVKIFRSLNRGARIAYDDVNPQSKTFDKKILDMMFPPDENGVRRIPLDENGKIDRPVTGLDFSSLYPSLIMAYNLSPEKIVFDEKEANRLMKKGYKLLKIEFLYGEPDSKNKEQISGYAVQYNPETFEGMGLYPKILKELFDKRKSIKREMWRFETAKEFLEKVFESHPLKGIVSLPQQEQKELIAAESLKNIDSAKEKAESTGKKFFEDKLFVAESIHKFLADSWVSEDGLYSKMSIDALFSEIGFKFNYFNSKQGALKIFMNTFYGETGNQLSPFFIVHVAGGITTMGQYNIKLVKSYVEGKDYSVVYGDTDSLYISPPDEVFAEADRKYETGETSKLEYWTEMVEITMENLDKLAIDVNNMLFGNNGTRFLNMAYEEVLYPVAMVGKKKYIGIPHQGIVNFSICKPECTLEEFMKSKLLFIRGLEMKKRGGSEFMRINCYKIWKDAFCITNTETLKEIVERTMVEILRNEWDLQMFARSKKYKLPQNGKPGNVSVLRFIERMQYLKKNLPELGIKCPEPGERFKSVVAKKYPWVYNIRGANPANVSVGDKLEFLESFENEKYKQYLENDVKCKLELDMDYYMTGEICGQFARFLLYHPDYDHYFREEMYENDAAYKEADKKAHTDVKNILRKEYLAKYGTVYPKMDKLSKDAYLVVQNRIMRKCGVEKKNQRRILDMISNELYNGKYLKNTVDGGVEYKDNDTLANIKAELVKKAKRLGVQRAESTFEQVAERMGMSVEKYYYKWYYQSTSDEKYGRGECWAKNRISELRKSRNKAIKALGDKVKKLGDKDSSYLKKLLDSVDEVKRKSGVTQSMTREIAPTTAEYDEKERKKIEIEKEEKQKSIVIVGDEIDETDEMNEIKNPIDEIGELVSEIGDDYTAVAVYSKQIFEIETATDQMRNIIMQNRLQSGHKLAQLQVVASDDFSDYSKWCVGVKRMPMFSGII